MMKNKILFSILIGFFVIQIKAQITKLGSPVVGREAASFASGVASDGQDIYSLKFVYDSSVSTNYFKISKYNSLFWTDLIKVPATPFINLNIPAKMYNGDLYFYAQFGSLTLGTKTYLQFSGIFKFDGTNISLVDRVTTVNGPTYADGRGLDTLKNKLIFVGYFDTIGNTRFKNGAEYDGSTWKALGTATQRSNFVPYYQVISRKGIAYITGYNETGSKVNYFGLARYDGTDMLPVDSNESGAVSGNIYGIYMHPDSNSYIINTTGTPIYYNYCAPGKRYQLIQTANPNIFNTFISTGINNFAVAGNAIYISVPGKNYDNANTLPSYFQKFIGNTVTEVIPSSQYRFEGSGGNPIFGKGYVFVEMKDKLNAYKKEYYQIGSSNNLSANVSGKVYLDNNKNCTFDSGDQPLPYKTIEIAAQDNYTVSDVNGNYYLPAIASGTSTLECIKEKNKKFVCPSTGTYALSLTTDSNVIRNFALEYDTTVKDLAVKTYSYWGLRARRGFTEKYYVEVVNNSIFTKSGQITVVAPSVFTNFVSLNSNLVFSGNLGSITFSNLKADEKRVYEYTMVAPTSLALNTVHTCFAYLDATLMNWDNDSTNDADTAAIKLLASCDPNDKTSNPAGYIPKGTENISYHINFQNVGNDTAYKVTVVDTVDLRLNIEKIVIGSSSHPYTLKIKGNNILIFEFDNIKLVDSATNEKGSKGYIRFSTKMDKNLPLGAKVNNRAHIYFDYNEAIITNIASVIIGNPSSKVKSISNHLGLLNVYPNPANASIIIENKNKQSVFEIYNNVGQLVKSGNLLEGLNTISTSDFTSGLYVIKTNEGSQKILIQH